MADGKLYTMWSDGTMTQCSFTETALGTPLQVDLNRLSAFATEMTTMTGAWYDAARGRLYFTLSGDPNLYYRYFLTENRLVGAERFTAPTGGVDWRSRSMFLFAP